jgi:uncharacterized protein with von Willebrand factor type A (vWA) domain
MLAENLVHFARILRAAGLTVGPDRVLQAMAALEAVGIDRRDDVHAALSAVMLDKHEQQPLFDAAFAAFWRDPKLLERMMALLLPRSAASRARRCRGASRKRWRRRARRRRTAAARRPATSCSSTRPTPSASASACSAPISNR